MQKEENRLEERDRLLPMRRNRLKTAIEEDLLGDDHIIAAFYGGSIGLDTEDLYSDIDLRIVVEDRELHSFVSSKRIRANQYGKVLFFEEADPLSSYTVAHYDSFIKVDTFYYAKESLIPSVWLRDIKLIKDSGSFMETIQAKSRSLRYEPTINEVEIWRTKFLANFHETYRRAMRGEAFYALKCLDSLCFSMATAWYMEQGIHPNTYGDWAHYEGKRSRLSSSQQIKLAEWQSRSDTKEIIEVSRKIIPEFLKVHQVLCSQTGTDENSEQLKEIIDLVC